MASCCNGSDCKRREKKENRDSHTMKGNEHSPPISEDERKQVREGTGGDCPGTRPHMCSARSFSGTPSLRTSRSTAIPNLPATRSLASVLSETACVRFTLRGRPRRLAFPLFTVPTAGESARTGLLVCPLPYRGTQSRAWLTDTDVCGTNGGMLAIAVSGGFVVSGSPEAGEHMRRTEKEERGRTHPELPSHPFSPATSLFLPPLPFSF